MLLLCTLEFPSSSLFRLSPVLVFHSYRPPGWPCWSPRLPHAPRAARHSTRPEMNITLRFFFSAVCTPARFYPCLFFLLLKQEGGGGWERVECLVSHTSKMRIYLVVERALEIYRTCREAKSFDPFSSSEKKDSSRQFVLFFSSCLFFFF